MPPRKRVRRSTDFGSRPKRKRYVQASPFYFSGKKANDLPKLFKVDRFRFIPETPYTDLYGRHYRGGHLGFLPLVRQGGVAHGGIYTLRVRAAAVGRTHDYGNALGDFRNGDPLVMEVAAVDRRGSVESTGNVSKMISLARVELTNESPQWYSWQVYIDQGFEPEVRFRNGPLAAKRMVRVLTSRAGDKPEFKAFAKMKAGMTKSHGVLKAYRGPRLRVWEIQLEGPHIEAWPTPGHRRLYGDLSVDDIDRASAAQRIRHFASVAFRRPVRDGEVEPILRLVEQKFDEGLDPLAALQLGFQAVLCSPGFLYLEHGSGELDSYALASRLSYFLWSSQPDKILLDLAATGTLGANLDAQVDRMLADTRSDRFVRNFLRTWLDLDNIGAMPVSKEFLAYHRDNLQTAMRNETETFFRHVLDRNLPPRELLSADYTFLNRELALHYGIQDIAGNEMRRVSLQGTVRGGLLTQGSLLTASANGVDTSPVVRGVYVLEKLLGYTPPPPPPDVPEIEPDIRGALTVRDQLEKHRQIPTCARCHRKIDPIGFALENFDATGGWRKEYGKGRPVDATGQLPDGQTFATVPEFRSLLLQQETAFVHGLTEKLMTYALGREMDAGDRETIDRIVTSLESKNEGFRDLIHHIVSSDRFGRN